MDVLVVARTRRCSDRVLGDVREQPQLDLAVVGGDELVARLGDEGAADLRPSSVRMGMFWRFGSVEDSRPVAVAAWWKVVWMRPSCATSAGSVSR